MSGILSGLFGGGKRGGGIAGNLSGGMKLAAVALLAHELMKHAGQERQQAQGTQHPQQPQGGQETTGGLGGLLGGLTGGAGLGGLLGGLGGLLGQLRSHGMGQQVDSWISKGPNQQVSPQQLEVAFDPKDVDQAAQQAGTDRGSLMEEVSRLLPGLVDRMTPQGRIPQGEHELGSGGLGGLLGSLLGGDAAGAGDARDSLHGGAGNAPEAGTGAMGSAAATHGGTGGEAARNSGLGAGGEAGMPRLDQGTASGGTAPASGQGGPPQPRGTGPERET